jgi:glycosyltransferase involved in cell wall biosynthesis
MEGLVPNRHPAGLGLRISVVIPVHNGIPWLKETLASVLHQTYPHELLDVIVVDDGSTDSSSEVAAAFLAESDIAGRIVSVSDAGPGGARNAGWKASSADWIQFLDADDLIAPGKIAAQARAATVVDTGVSVIYSDWQSIEMLRGAWTPGEIRAPIVSGDVTADLLESDNFIATGSQIFRRESLVCAGGFNEQFRLIEDVDLLLRISIAGGGFHRLSGTGPVFQYRRHEGSLSLRDPRQFIEGCLRNALLVENHWQQVGQLTESRARRLANIYHQGARYFAANDRGRFEELAHHIHVLCREFVPSAPALLRNASRLLGYRRAELLSVAYRRAKAFCKGLGAGSAVSPR